MLTAALADVERKLLLCTLTARDLSALHTQPF